MKRVVGRDGLDVMTKFAAPKAPFVVGPVVVDGRFVGTVRPIKNATDQRRVHCVQAVRRVQLAFVQGQLVDRFQKNRR